MEPKEALTALSALAQETRLAIFRRLITMGLEGESAGAIADALEIPAPTLSFHLKELEHAGLTTTRRDGRSVIHAARYDGMRDLLGFLMRDCCGGRPEICKIDLKACA